MGENKKAPRTYVAIVLDKSGSMGKTPEQISSTISGFNEQIQALKEDAKTQGIYCSLVTFNGKVFEHLWNVPALELEETNHEDYVPKGATAMRDAVGFVINKLIETTDYQDENTAYLVKIISDGETNADQHYDVKKYSELIRACEGTNKWTFTYLGCNKEYMRAVSEMVGVASANMASWDNQTSDNIKCAFSNVRKSQRKYFAERAMGQLSSKHYCGETDVVDYSTEELAFAAPTPVIEKAVNIEFKDILDKLPKYECSANSYKGGSLFANSSQVNWK